LHEHSNLSSFPFPLPWSSLVRRLELELELGVIVQTFVGLDWRTDFWLT
jgi:hypothetical protein